MPDDQPSEADGQATGTQDQSDKSGGANQQQAVEVPDYLKGTVDEKTYSAMPEDARKSLSEYGKKLYGDYTRKSMEVAELRRLKTELESDPEKLSHIKKSMTEYDARKAGIIKDTKTPEDVEDYLKDATPEQRQAFDLLDKRYRKPLEDANSRVADLESKLNSVLSDRKVSRQESVETDLASLPSGFKELGDKYREQIIQMATKPGASRFSAKKLIQFVSTDSEYERAVLASNSEQTKKQTEKVRDNATAKPQSTIASQQDGEVARLKSRDARFKKGPVDVGGMLKGVFDSVKRGMPS